MNDKNQYPTTASYFSAKGWLLVSLLFLSLLVLHPASAAIPADCTHQASLHLSCETFPLGKTKCAATEIVIDDSEIIAGANVTLQSPRVVFNGGFVVRDLGILQVTGYTGGEDGTVDGSSMLESVDFLFTEPNPVQTGVVPGTIEAKRVAVIRGLVLDIDNTPLPDVTISIKDHPEFGQTLSQPNGGFDMAVNGGGLLTVQYAIDGYLPAQRQADTPWRGYALMPDVILIKQDTRVTEVDLTSSQSIQVARASAVSDKDGDRQATVLIPQGTTAEIILPDGSTQPVDTLNVRITEYTVGDNGPAAMPATLPASSAYTYAFEIRADESVSKIDGRDLLLSQPIAHYVENFIGAPVGTAVPLGYYDNTAGHWVASDDGRVIKVLSVTAGMADVDVDGDDVADTGESLTELGITEAEREQLAQLYTPGQTLSRVQLNHFSTWDPNYAWVRVDDDSYKKDVPSAKDKDDRPEEPSCQGGSIIECESRVLGETLSVTGAPFARSYRSDLVPGRLEARTVDIPLSGPVLPGSFDEPLQNIRLDINIAGQHHRFDYNPVPNLVHTFEWDGLDGYGRTVIGAQKVEVEIAYSFRRRYSFCPPQVNDGTWVRVPNSFGRPAGGIPDCTSSEPLRQLRADAPIRWSDMLTAVNPGSVHLGGVDTDCVA